jgi:hypothetical protein
MGWGSAFADTMSSASDSVMGALRSAGSAASDAASTAASLAKSAAQAASSAAISGATAVSNAAGRAYDAANSVASTVANKAGATALLGGEVLFGAGAYGAIKTLQPVAGAYGAAKSGAKAIKETFSPHVPVAQPCLPCLAHESAEMRKARIERRQALIAQGQQSNDPAVRNAASELQGDMKGVEMARLSENTYAQYDPDANDYQKKPPEPWHAMTPDELQEAGINADDVSASKAVIYKAPDDFPVEPKTVVAFRGTTGETEDIFTDHDQALGLQTNQYDAAQRLGKQIGAQMPDAETTGHSLGGGKAQVAAIAGGLDGQMFNSAGPNPKTLGMPADGLDRYADNFVQYRSAGGLSSGGGDPLTGTQNSMTAQKAALGFVKGLRGVVSANKWATDQLGLSDYVAGKVPDSSKELAGGLLDRVLKATPEQAQKNFDFSGGKWYIPPALGEIRGVPSKTAEGDDSSIPAQHSIVNLVYGIESRKSGDIQILLAGTDNPGPPGNYIGPMVLK